MFGFLTDLISDIAGGFYRNLPGQVASIFDDELPELTPPDVTFQPFTVTDAFGGTIKAGEDGTTYSLGGNQKALANMLSSGASNFFQQAQMDPAAREQAVFDRMMTAMSPAQERERLNLENRLASQGRLGIQTNQFGGTPEALALAKAQEEARNSAMLSAMQQAQREQAQQAALGTTFMQQSYAPQAAMLSAFSPALNVASMADVARRQQGEFDFNADLANLEALLGQQAGQAGLYSNLFGGAMNMAGGVGGGLLSALGSGGLFGSQGLFGSIFDNLFGDDDPPPPK